MRVGPHLLTATRGISLHSDGSRAALAESGSPEELQTRLIEIMGEDTLPAILEVTRGARPGTVDARLFYRTLVLREIGVRYPLRASLVR